VLAIGRSGHRVSRADASSLIFGHSCAPDMTRREPQLAARDKDRPLDLGHKQALGAAGSG
jgi:fumarylpyruvate hydrolase